MQLKNEICEVLVKLDSTYKIDSRDNIENSNIVLNPNSYKEFYSILRLKIHLTNKNLDIILVGESPSYDEECAILEKNILTILTNNEVTQIDVTNGNIVNNLKFPCKDCTFSIHKLDNNRFIIYGEQYIRMIDNNLNELWNFSGKDIFVSISGKNPFEICNDRIKLYDFEDNYYEINFDGKQINQEKNRK